MRICYAVLVATAMLSAGAMRPLSAQTVATPVPLATPGPEASPEPAGLSAVLATNAEAIARPSRQTIGPVLAEIGRSGTGAISFLEAWEARQVGRRKSDGRFFLIAPAPDGYALTDPATGASAGTAPKPDITELKPNAGVRGLIASVLVEFQLSDPDPRRRHAALEALARDASVGQLAPLRASIETETDPALRAAKLRLERLLTLRFDADGAARVAAIEHFRGDLGLDLRAALNPLLATGRQALAGPPDPGLNIARKLVVGRDLTEAEAYDLLVTAGMSQPRLDADGLRASLAAHVVDGAVGGVPLADLASPEARERAFTALEAAGTVPPAATDAEVAAALAAHDFVEVYREPDAAVTAAAVATLGAISTRLGAMQAVDLGLDALSLASIYFLAAIGLAITFGVMGVINMAHGEFIMMGAYTGYVVQQVVPDYTLSLVVALPAAFIVTFAAGVALERLVIRHLYKRPLETLLATFGVSIALQQLFKNIFGTQAQPLTAPAWLDGAFDLNDIVSISYIRVAIFVLALLFLGFFLWLMNRTRLGLEVRAVTQNPAMAASMGINPDRINMLTFGLGSGIAGIAGVAIGLFAKVTSELGQDYIVQSFMTVVVGGVGNIWGTLAGALMIGTFQKGIEWFNPSNTLAAQTYMILVIILFIQIRPRGIIALRGRAAGD